MQTTAVTANSVRLPAEPTETSGLVIVPDFHGRYDDTWSVIHEPSGAVVVSAATVDLDCGIDIDKLTLPAVRRIATALGGLPVDWTAGKDAVAAQRSKNKAEFAVAVRAAIRSRRR